MSYRAVNKAFVDFFVKEGFDNLPESSLLDPSIPMSFVMSVGLVQVEASSSETQLSAGRKLVLVQPCFRYFDMSRVGKSSIHLSLFHMPGAFSFGPSNRYDVINRVWSFLTKELGIDAGKLWVTWFDGTRDQGSHSESDIETEKAWLRLGLHPNHLVPMGAKQNYWLQGGGIDGVGKKRKCGPNTEIFYELGTERICGTRCLPGCNCGRFVEIANTLFVEYETEIETGSVTTLSLPFAETVIGSERIAMVLQKRDSVFEITTLWPMMVILNGVIKEPQVDTINSRRIIIDHMRAIFFLVANGATEPGKGGRPRLMRKLIRSVLAHEIVLGLENTATRKLLLQELVTHEALPTNPEELLAKIDSYFDLETAQFRKVVEKGQRLVDKMIQTHTGGSLSGRKVIELEKSHGVPVPLIRTMLQQRGLHFPRLGYEQELEKWKGTQ